MDLRSLEPGRLLVDEEMSVSPEEAAAYCGAVEDDAALYREQAVAPPLAVAAMALGRAMRAVELPAGAVHAGQELEFASPVVPGETLRCSAYVAQNATRGGTRFLGVDLRVTRRGETVVAGRASILVPEESST